MAEPTDNEFLPEAFDVISGFLASAGLKPSDLTPEAFTWLQGQVRDVTRRSEGDVELALQLLVSRETAVELLNTASSNLGTNAGPAPLPTSAGTSTPTETEGGFTIPPGTPPEQIDAAFALMEQSADFLTGEQSLSFEAALAASANIDFGDDPNAIPSLIDVRDNDDGSTTHTFQNPDGTTFTQDVAASGAVSTGGGAATASVTVNGKTFNVSPDTAALLEQNSFQFGNLSAAEKTAALHDIMSMNQDGAALAADVGFKQQDFEQAQLEFDKLFEQNAEQFQAEVGESQRQFDITTEEGRRAFDLQFGENQRQFDAVFGLDQSQLEEQARQFDAGFGLNEQQLQEQARQFNESTTLQQQSLEEQARQANQDLGFNQEQLQQQAFQFAQSLGLDERLAAEASSQFAQNLGFQQTSLEQAALQFAQSLGFDERQAQEVARQFNEQLGFQQQGLQEQSRQFNETQGFNEQQLQQQAFQFAQSLGLDERQAAELSRQFNVGADFNQQQLQQQALQFAQSLGFDERQAQEVASQFAQSLGFQQQSLQEQARQANQQTALSRANTLTNVAPQLGQQALNQSQFIAEILRNPSDFLARAFFQRGGTSPQPEVTQADILSQLSQSLSGLDGALGAQAPGGEIGGGFTAPGTAPTGGFTAQTPTAGFTAGQTAGGFEAQAAPTGGFTAGADLTGGFTAGATPTGGLTAQTPEAGFTAGPTPTAGFEAQAAPTGGFTADGTPTGGFTAGETTGGFTTGGTLDGGFQAAPLQLGADANLTSLPQLGSQTPTLPGEISVNGLPVSTASSVIEPATSSSDSTPIVSPTGNQVIQRADGSVVIINPDGSETLLRSGGADGTIGVDPAFQSGGSGDLAIRPDDPAFDAALAEEQIGFTSEPAPAPIDPAVRQAAIDAELRSLSGFKDGGMPKRQAFIAGEGGPGANPEVIVDTEDGKLVIPVTPDVAKKLMRKGFVGAADGGFLPNTSFAPDDPTTSTVPTTRGTTTPQPIDMGIESFGSGIDTSQFPQLGAQTQAAPLPQGAQNFGIPQLPNFQAPTQQELVGLAQENAPPAVSSIFGGNGQVDPLRFGFALPTIAQTNALTPAEQAAAQSFLASGAAGGKPTTLEDVQTAQRRRFGGTRTAPRARARAGFI